MSSWIQIKEVFIEFLKRILLKPFTHKVSRIFLITGSSLIIFTPVFKYVIIGAILNAKLGTNIPIEGPDLKAYIAGTILMFFGGLHNLLSERLLVLKRRRKSTQNYKELWKILYDSFSKISDLYNLFIDQNKANEFFEGKGDNKVFLPTLESIKAISEFVLDNLPFLEKTIKNELIKYVQTSEQLKDYIWDKVFSSVEFVVPNSGASEEFLFGLYRFDLEINYRKVTNQMLKILNLIQNEI